MSDVGDVSQGYGGVLHFEYSNVYIANSKIEFGEAYQGGGVFVFDTIFEIFDVDILNNEASQNGGGIYQTLYDQYTNFDLCVSILRSRFTDNSAAALGGAIYSKLHGKDANSNSINNRQSCFKIINGTFTNNGNVSVYVNVTQGEHKVLRNQGELSTFCPNQDECTDFKSVLSHLCVAEYPNECKAGEWDIFSETNPLTVVRQIPGASVIVYVYGADAFNNRLLNTEFSIFASADGAQVVSPAGSQSKADLYQYLVPFVVLTGSKAETGTISIADAKGVAETINIELQITDCDPGYHQEQLTQDSDLFECNYCAVDKYTMGTSPCKTCPQGLEV